MEVVARPRAPFFALQWADIDGETVVVRRSLAYSPLEGVTVTDGKTGKAGHRVVAIDPDLARLLQQHRRRQVEQGSYPVAVGDHLHLCHVPDTATAT